MKSTQLSLVLIGLHDFQIFPESTAHACSVEVRNICSVQVSSEERYKYPLPRENKISQMPYPRANKDNQIRQTVVPYSPSLSLKTLDTGILLLAVSTLELEMDHPSD